jgi:hypothetical protein
MTIRELNISEARRELPRLIHDLERHPETSFRIRVRRHCVAELRAVSRVDKAGMAADRLAVLSRRRWSSTGKGAISRDVDRILYDHP